MEFAYGKLDILEKMAGVEFAPGGHGEAVFEKHVREAGDGVEEVEREVGGGRFGAGFGGANGAF